LYDTLYKKSFLKEYKTFREFLDKNTDKEKISKIKSILSVVFNAENIERNGIILKYWFYLKYQYTDFIIYF